MTLEEYQREYDRLFGWRERWTKLSNKHERNRLCTRQERIEERAKIADNKIRALMKRYDEEREALRATESVRAYVVQDTDSNTVAAYELIEDALGAIRTVLEDDMSGHIEINVQDVPRSELATLI